MPGPGSGHHYLWGRFGGIIIAVDKKSKILILVFVLVILLSIFLTYKRSFVDQNFIIVEEEEEEFSGEEASEEGEENQ